MKAAIYLSSLLTAFTLVFAVSFPAYAAEVTVHHQRANEAIATVNTYNECEDNSFGVTVIENMETNVPGDVERTAEVQVFGNFDNLCDPSQYETFVGSSTLQFGEFRQSGVRKASLQKTLTIAGHEIELDLEWEGEGETLVYESKIDDEGPPRVRGKESTSIRTANVTGSFIIDGQELMTGTSSIHGNLHLIRNHHMTYSP